MRVRVLILIACLSLVCAAAFAHGGEEHVIGTVAKTTADSIIVKTVDNRMVTVAVTPDTKFTKDKATAKLADLTVGDRIVIHAKEPTEGHLVADTVAFAPAKSARTAPAQQGQH